MDFQKADQVGHELVSSLLGEQELKPSATVRHLFFGAATPKGAVDHIPTLTAQLGRRIFIKGRPGSGKSTLLKRLARAAEERGYDVDVFHCGFDPNSLDMLIFPERNLAIFDSTAPHEYFPSRSGDEVLDMYERTMEPGTDERYADELKAIQQRYSQKMQEATAFLKEAQQIHSRIKVAYMSATDFSKVDALCTDLQQEVRQLATLR
jgi:ABC-type glutathione transport system ATPase component